MFLSKLEWAVLIIVFLVVVLGHVFFLIDVKLFEQFTYEDGIIEYLTLLGLLGGIYLSLHRIIKLWKYKNWRFLLINALLALFLFFVAGEEISWGQRIFSVETPEFFQKNNAQNETNLHNLVVGGVKINKLIFTYMLIAGLGAYLLILPYLHSKNIRFRNWIDSNGIVVPQRFHIVSFLLLFLLTSLIGNSKNAELLECGATSIFFLIIYNPKNLYIFEPGNSKYKLSKAD